MNGAALNGSSACPMWLPPVPPRTDGRTIEPQEFMVPFVPKVVQQPRDVRDYDFNFSDLVPYDDTVTDATVTVEPAGLTADKHVTHPRVKVWLSDGVAGAAHKVSVVAHTAGGRSIEADIQVRIKER